MAADMIHQCHIVQDHQHLMMVNQLQGFMVRLSPPQVHLHDLVTYSKLIKLENHHLHNNTINLKLAGLDLQFLNSIPAMNSFIRDNQPLNRDMDPLCQHLTMALQCLRYSDPPLSQAMDLQSLSEHIQATQAGFRHIRKCYHLLKYKLR